MKFEAVIKRFNSIALKPSLLSAKAKILIRQGDLKQALNLLDQAIEITKQSFVTIDSQQQVYNLLFEKAEILLMMELYDEVNTTLEKMISIFPFYAKAHYIYAKMYTQLNKKDELEESIQKLNQIWKYADENYDFEFFSCLNSDMIVMESGWLDKLSNPFLENAKMGITGPFTLNLNWQGVGEEAGDFDNFDMVNKMVLYK